MYNDNHRTRVVTTLLLACVVLALWAWVALQAGGSTALYFALGLPSAGIFIALIVVIACPPKDEGGRDSA